MGMVLRLVTIGLILTWGAAAPAFARATYFPPPDAEGGWRVPRDADEARQVAGMDVDKLHEAFRYVERTTKNGGLLVVHDGWLVHEGYFGKGHREATPNLASCGKSFTSIAVGILLHERRDLFPRGLDQKVFTPRYLPPEAFPLTDPAKADIKLGHLLAMSGGIRGNNPSYVRGERRTIDPPGPDGWRAMIDDVAFGKSDYVVSDGSPFTTKTLWCKPGEGYSYATSSIHLASVVLRHVTKVGLQDFITPRLAEPLGWSRWGFAFRNTAATRHTPGGGGIAMRGTDMLRFGYLLLNQGRWREKQLVPAAYIRQATRRSPYNPHYPFSLQFDVNTNGQHQSLPRDAFWKAGSGGHVLYVVPSAKLVVFKLGGRDGQYDPSNTGLPLPAGTEKANRPPDWKPKVQDAREAAVKTLELVLAAVVPE